MVIKIGGCDVARAKRYYINLTQLWAYTDVMKIANLNDQQIQKDLNLAKTGGFHQYLCQFLLESSCLNVNRKWSKHFGGGGVRANNFKSLGKYLAVYTINK